MRYSPAFTLIELIVVLALIGLLTGLGYTQFSKFQEKSAQNLATSQLKNYFTLARSYAMSRQSPPGVSWNDIDKVKVVVNLTSKTIDIVGVNGSEESTYLTNGPVVIPSGVNYLLGGSLSQSTVIFNKYKGDIDTSNPSCVDGAWCVQIQNTQNSSYDCLLISSSGVIMVNKGSTCPRL